MTTGRMTRDQLLSAGPTLKVGDAVIIDGPLGNGLIAARWEDENGEYHPVALRDQDVEVDA